MIFCARFTAAINSSTTTTLLVSNEPFATESGDTPANTPALHRLMQPGNFVRSISGDKMLLGLARIQHGECVIANADGALDAWAGYGVGDRAFDLYCCESLPGSFPTGWTLVFTATMESIRATRDTIVVRLKELTSQLDSPICDAFAGTGGIEGPAERKGESKPIVYGGPYNVSPTLIDGSLLIYMASSRGSVAANHLKDDGSVIARALTAGDDGDATTIDQDGYETYAGLAAAIIPRGHYATVASLGVFKCGSVPVGQLTCDPMQYTGPETVPAYGAGDRWTQGATGTTGEDEKAYWGHIIKSIAVDAGVDAADVNATDLTAAEEGQYGFWACDTGTTYAQAVDKIAASARAWCGFDRTGSLRFQQVPDPSGEVNVYDITVDNAISLEPVVSRWDNGVPYWKAAIKYPKNWSAQSTFAGIVPESVRAEASKEWPRGLFDREITVQQKHPNAGVLEVERYSRAYRVTSDGDLNVLGDEDPFVTALTALFVGDRQWFECKLPFSTGLITTVDVGSVVGVTWPRWGLDPEKNFLVVGIRYELSADPWVALTLWG